MRLGIHELERHLQQGLKSLYVLTGDEPLQMGEAADMIRKAARDQGYQDRIIFEVNQQFDWNELLAESDNLSLFAELRIFDLRIPGGKPGKDGSKALVQYIDNPPADTLMLITLPRLEKAQNNSKWYKALEAAGVIVQIWPVTDNRLPPWIEQRMRQKGLTPEKDVVRLLAQRIEGNLLAASQEIDKLLLQYGPGIITTEQLISSVADSARFDSFGLVDAALGKRPARVIRIINGLKQEAVPLPMILGALAHEIRQLAQLSHQLTQGQNLQQITRHIWQKRRQLVEQGLKNHNCRHWQKLLQLCATTDRAIKGQADADPWILIEEICLGMAGMRVAPQQAI